MAKDISIQELAYKPGVRGVVERHRLLWTRRMPRGILARIDPDDVPFQDPLASCPDGGAMAAAWEHNYCVRAAVDDDLLPVARVSFGSAAFGAYLGAEVSFDAGAGWSRPLGVDYPVLQQLQISDENPWVQRHWEACTQFLHGAAGRFAVCETEPMDGLNLLELLRGPAVYTDLYDRPADVHQLLEWACELNIDFVERQRAVLAPALRCGAGLYGLFRIWLPGDAVWISVDAYGLCSPAVFREFGAPHLRRTLAHFGAGWVHLHASALHLLPEIVKLPYLLGIGIADDPQAKRGFDQLRAIRSICGDVPLQIDCTGEELERGMAERTLPGGVMYMVHRGVDTTVMANALAARVREYRAP